LGDEHVLPVQHGCPAAPHATHEFTLQMWFAAHVPHWSVPPQPLEIEPQSSPPGQVVVGVQPQTFVVPPPPQVLGAVHVLPASPTQHGWPAAPHATHALFWQVCVGSQVPQVTLPPHPSGMVPHWSAGGQVVTQLP
jgi:hypothetical protein